jgi:hypothetical protein
LRFVNASKSAFHSPLYRIRIWIYNNIYFNFLFFIMYKSLAPSHQYSRLSPKVIPQKTQWPESREQFSHLRLARKLSSIQHLQPLWLPQEAIFAFRLAVSSPQLPASPDKIIQEPRPLYR